MKIKDRKVVLDSRVKPENDATHNKGRSMVEMLGVLAIIGILSAGALAGYSKAMFRHKVNQTIDIFQGVLQRFAELEQKGWGKVDIEGAADLVKYGFLPGCQEAEDKCKIPLGLLGIQATDDSLGQYGEIFVDFTSSKECIAFASAHWENVAPVDWWNPRGFISIGNQIVYDPSGSSGSVDTEITMSEITESCQRCDDSEEGFCEYYFVIHRDF